MRITGGESKGIQLRVPIGRFIRPTTDRIREAIFNILENTDGYWGCVLDLYAGSGALGIEALSRGAEWVDFIDQNRKSCSAINHNLNRISYQDKAHVYCCSVSKAITFLDNCYNVIFMDPPYSDPSIDGLLTTLASSKILKQMSTIVVSHTKQLTLRSDYAGLHLIRQRSYGDSHISIYRQGGLSYDNSSLPRNL
jgi:16S rRNA (guanine966-N2)-methyltransferase